jgi:DNA-binding response OmpR family regulator
MRHVLVVDNQPDIRAVVQMGLEDLGHYRVTTAASGDQAVVLLAADRPDLVVLNAVLPGMSGIELAARAVHQDIPVLVLTGEPATEARLERAGWPHLRKPFHLQNLLAEVRATIAQSRENTQRIRSSLDRLFQTAGDLQRTIDALCDLRGRVEETVTRSRHRHEPLQNGSNKGVKPTRH